MNKNFRCNYCKQHYPKTLIKKMGGSQFCSEDCIQAKQEKMQEKARNNKGINKVSKKKQKRIREGGGEKELFLEIWNEREHNCIECNKYLKSAKAHNFDHVIPKSKGEEYRLDKNNIKIVCFKCHYEKTNGGEYKGIDFDL